jgi:hypothetical protein
VTLTYIGGILAVIALVMLVLHIEPWCMIVALGGFVCVAINHRRIKRRRAA